MKPPSVRRLPEASALSWDDCRLLVQSVTDYAIFMLHPDGTIATWNVGAERLKGYAPDEIIGEHFSKFYLPEDVLAQKPDRLLAMVRRVGRVEDEGLRVRKDGTRYWANVVITPLRDADGTIRGFATVTRDLTERRAAEEGLRRSEERFRLLVESASDYAIYMVDPDGRISTWNVGAERMKGYSAGEIVGASFAEFFPEEGRLAGKPARELDIARTEGRFSEEAWRIRKDGSRFWAHVTLTPIRDAHGELLGFTKVTRDLTLREQAERAERTLAEARVSAQRADDAARRAQEANRMKDEFLATVSHELRTPLHAILGWSSLLGTRTLEPSVAQAIAGIQRNAEAQARLIDDILDASRIITGKLQLQLEPTDMITVVNQAIETFRTLARAKDVTLEFDPGSQPRILVCDRERLRQIVSNLLSNAVKFTDEGGAISVSVDQEGSDLSLSVRDDGCGIDADFLPHVFDRFQQADSSPTRQFGGLGLGLSIVRYLVEVHGGRVSAESEGNGRGTLVRVTLPIVAVVGEEEAPEPPFKPAEPELVAVAGLRVLVVDDDADSRALLDTVLATAGAVVEAAESAATGFEAIKRFQPHVLVSDIGMPEEDGYSFVRRLRALSPAEGGDTPSIALTAYTREEDRDKALSAGFTKHLGKPVHIGTLLAAVADLGASSRPRG